METVKVGVTPLKVSVEIDVSAGGAVTAIRFVSDANGDERAHDFIRELYCSLKRRNGFRKTLSTHEDDLSIEILGWNRIKMRLSRPVSSESLQELLRLGERYGKTHVCYSGQKVSITRA